MFLFAGFYCNGKEYDDNGLQIFSVRSCPFIHFEKHLLNTLAPCLFLLANASEIFGNLISSMAISWLTEESKFHSFNANVATIQ